MIRSVAAVAKSLIAPCVSFLCASAFLGGASSQAAQAGSQVDEKIVAMAEQLTPRLHKAKAKRVLVLDLHGVRGEVHPLGRWLSNQIAEALRKVAPDLALVDETQVPDSEKGASSANGNPRGKAAVLSKGQSVKADAVIAGNYARTGGELRVILNALSVRQAKNIGMLGTFIQLSDEMRALSAEPIPEFDGDFLKVAAVGKMLRCEQCPPPEYTEEARSARFEGTVTLEVAVSATGHVESAIVIKDPGYGMAQKALDVVRTWRLKPEVGPDGNPRPSRAIVEVAFRIR